MASTPQSTPADTAQMTPQMRAIIERSNSQVVWVPVGELTPDPDNARRHPVYNIESIRLMLRRYGQQKPIVVGRDNVIIAGNGTHRAACDEGWSHIAVTYSQLTGAEARAYGIGDNAAGESSEWDYVNFVETLKRLEEQRYPMEHVGIREANLRELLKATSSADHLKPDAGQPNAGAGPDQNQGAEKLKFKSLTVTAEQYDTIKRATDILRRQLSDATMKDGRALELLCADWAAGN